MKQIIDIETWDRRDNFMFFKEFLDPCISICSEVECGDALRRAKERGESFFLHYLYAILRSANEIKELRYRINHNDEVILFDTLDVVTPIHIKETGKFYTVRIAWHEDFATFHREARRVIAEIPVDGDPYEIEKNTTGDNQFNIILVSATPELFFTSVTHTQKHKNGADYPLINVGKAVMRDGRLVVPVAIYVHHGLIDGIHIGDFYTRTQQYLNNTL